jgi:peptidoglycan/xylan/chitin deacetylase (PgdA/CDA1 family)
MARGVCAPVVIGYHRIVEDFSLCAETYIPSMLISTQMLEQHIDWLSRHHTFVSLAELGKGIEDGRVRRRPVVALTFDDGYRDFYELAFPLLQRKGVPAALFVVSGLVGTPQTQAHDALYLLLTRRSPNWWFPQTIQGIRIPNISTLTPFEATRLLIETLPSRVLSQLIESMKTEDPHAQDALQASCSVTWEMITRMHRAGITIGSHTKTHVLLPNETASVKDDETTSSRTELERQLDSPVEHFAYPSGAWDEVSVKSVAAAQYRFAFTTCGHQNRELPRLTIPRTLLWERSCLGRDGHFSGAVMSCLIEGTFDFIGGCRNTHRSQTRTQSKTAPRKAGA